MRFGEYLANSLKRKRLSQRAFATLVDYQQQAISEVVRGVRTPPLVHLSTWADALDDAIDRDTFMELARLEHCPPEIRTLVADLRKQVVRLTRQIR